jgi:uncharacterized membrane protein YcfT
MGTEMGRSTQAAATGGGQRIDWVDYAKGFCIIFVVMMHSTLGVENLAGREGWLHTVVDFAKPFRMPDFFLISGLFLAQVIDRDWRTYLDRKVVPSPTSTCCGQPSSSRSRRRSSCTSTGR